MAEPALVGIILKKLFHLDSPIIRRLLEMVCVVGVVWVASIAKQRGPSEIALVAQAVIVFGGIAIVFQGIFLLMTVIKTASTDLDDDQTKTG